MDQLTYDPVLDSQELSRVRLLKPLRPPGPGRALVLVPHRGTMTTIRHGEAVPDAHFGTYRGMFVIDTTEHRLVLSVSLLSRDPTFAFRGQVSLMCTVGDPAEVVARGIRDMSGALYAHIKRLLQRVARDYDIAEFHAADDALNSAVRSFSGDSAVRLRDIRVELLVDEDEIASSGRSFRDVERESRLAAMKRQQHLDLLRTEGPEGLIAEIMEREGPRAAWELISSAEGEERRQLQEAMSLLFKRDDLEPWELEEARRAVMDRVLGDSDAPFGGTRRSRLRGSLSSSPGPRELRGRPELVPGGSAPEPTVVRGEVMRRPIDPPPEDEPLGGPGTAASDYGRTVPAPAEPEPARLPRPGVETSRLRGSGVTKGDGRNDDKGRTDR